MIFRRKRLKYLKKNLICLMVGIMVSYNTMNTSHTITSASHTITSASSKVGATSTSTSSKVGSTSTSTSSDLVVGLKTNCKRGYNKLAKCEAELNTTEQWIIKEILAKGMTKQAYGRLYRFLMETNKSIKVAMPTTLKPYTNKRGITTMKHYTRNGHLINHLKEPQSVLFPTWIKMTEYDLLSTYNRGINDKGTFTSFDTQTIFTFRNAHRSIDEEQVDRRREQKKKDEEDNARLQIIKEAQAEAQKELESDSDEDESDYGESDDDDAPLG